MLDILTQIQHLKMRDVLELQIINVFWYTAKTDIKHQWNHSDEEWFDAQAIHLLWNEPLQTVAGSVTVAANFKSNEANQSQVNDYNKNVRVTGNLISSQSTKLKMNKLATL